MTRRSVAVLGAGPAGLAAALLLARDGHRVTVFERFATPQPLGSGLMLQPTGLAVLAALGLGSRIATLGQPIHRLFGRRAGDGRVVLDVRYDQLGPGRFAIAVHRAALFGTLFEAVTRSSEIALETGRAVTSIDGGADGRPSAVFEQGRRAGPFDLVIDAMGARSPLAARFGPGDRLALAYGALWASLPWPADGFDAHALEQRYRGASVMVGVLPIGRRSEHDTPQAAFFWSLKGDDYAAWRREGLAAWKERVLALWPQTAPLLGAITDAEQLTMARYAHHTLRSPVAGRLVAIGDAAHATSPQLGQGANMALLDARALALALRDPGDVAAALARYAALRRWHVRLYQALSAAFTPFYQSDSVVLPLLRDRGLAPATRLPVVRRLIARVVAGQMLDPLPGLQLEASAEEPSPTGALA